MARRPGLFMAVVLSPRFARKLPAAGALGKFPLHRYLAREPTLKRKRRPV